MVRKVVAAAIGLLILASASCGGVRNGAAAALLPGKGSWVRSRMRLAPHRRHCGPAVGEVELSADGETY